jgi:hypothetical protein
MILQSLPSFINMPLKRSDLHRSVVRLIIQSLLHKELVMVTSRSLARFASSILLAVTLLVGLAGSANAYSDNVWWGNCSGRYIVGSVNIYDRNSAYVGKLTAYGCTNGYIFAHTQAKYKGKVQSVIYRTNPYGWLNAINYNGYAATTNMLADRRGSCFTASGSVPGGGKSFSFCR